MPDEEDVQILKKAEAVLEKTKVVDTDQLVESWWQEHFPNSAVARYTDAWNAAHAAKEDLKRRLQDV